MENTNKSELIHNHCDYESNIRWDKTNPEQLDLSYYSTIGKLARMILFGGIITQIWAVIQVCVSKDHTTLSVISSLLESSLYFSLTIISFIALVKRKHNAIFLSRSLLFICLLSWIIQFVVNIIVQPNTFMNYINIGGIIVLFWCIIGIVWTYADPDIKDVFPKSYRSHSVKDMLYVIFVWLFPILFNVYIVYSTIVGARNGFFSHIVESVNSDCPSDVEWGGVLTKAEYKGGELVFYVDVNEKITSVLKLKENRDLIHKYQLQRMQYTPQNHPLSNKVLSELGADVKFKITDKTESFDIIITEEEIKNSKKKKPTPYGLLLTKVKLMDIMLPVKVDEGINLVEAFVDGRILWMKYEVDEDIYDINSFASIKDELYENHYNEFFENLKNEFNELCNRCLDDIVYVYMGDSSKTSFEIKLETQSKMK